MQCPECVPLDRRQFLKTTALAGAAVATGTAASLSGKSSETLVSHLYESLSAAQKEKIVFDFNHALRSKIDNNWHITPFRIHEFFDRDQQEMITGIFKGLHNPEFVDQVMQHLVEDSGGIGDYSIALFGAPGSGKFEFVLTGRHCTARCDGDSVDGAAFGGPMLYGHASGSYSEAPDHPGNVYWYQAKRANEVFQALDGKQRAKALLGEPRPERGTATVAFKDRGAPIAGLRVSEMSRDQKELVDKVLADLLHPYRKQDRDEAMKYVRANGGADALTMSFYKNADIGNDGVWDVWELESPNMIWYFRGYPHVHTWVNIRAKA